ncbi:hypothetical protein [Klebsiella oxytoca]|uniref:Uncharacterized protein n=1 Tax=Klebsiella oxytoca TaxID=571 RepID=A0A6B8MU08_KLEOX|nr:hypothetical protein [Klebsiella oxytoca]QGN38429.1 hypothetical protein GJ746_14440 [Klebsiella oxytoca]
MNRARARRVEHRRREQRAEWVNFPEAMLRICPGYRPADGGETEPGQGALSAAAGSSAQSG